MAAAGAKFKKKDWARRRETTKILRTSKNKYHVTDECAVLVKMLSAELCVVKALLAHVTQSLNAVNIVLPPSHHECRPSKTLKKYPVLKTFTPRLSEDPPLLPVPLCTDQPPIPLLELTSRSSKHISQKVKKVDVSAPTSTSSSETIQHFLDVVDKHEEERTKARERYLTLMRSHIDKQLQQFSEREKQIKRKRERRENREKAARIQSTPSRLRSTGEDDRTYLENMYQSCLYKIVNVEHGLRKCGKLKTTGELKAFWEEMLAPLQTPAPTKSAAPTSSTADLIENELQILQEEDCTNSWAITSSAPSNSKQVRYTSDCASTTPTPLKFVSCKLPDLKPIKEILDENSEDQSVKLLVHSNMYQSPSVKLRRRTQLLYQRAKANEMAMKTLFPCREEFDHPSFTASLPSSIPSSPATQHCTLVLPPLLPVPDSSHDKDSKSLEPDTTDQPFFVKATTSENINHSSSTINISSKPVCVPLTMSELMQSSPVKESKGKPLLWTNYQLAGK